MLFVLAKDILPTLATKATLSALNKLSKVGMEL